jgi:poly(A) polymerase
MNLKKIMLSSLILESQKEEVALQLLKSLIKGTKFENKAYIAGGYVRDQILGKPSKDIDIVVELPQGGIEFANFITQKLNIYKDKTNPVIFPTYGTAKFTLYRVNYKGQDLSNIDIECVMTRKEQYHNGSRNPDVTPGTLKDDVDRRDFTVNSLLRNLSTDEIVDLTGMGKDDIKKGIVRTPLNPDIIFSEDPLRMLRAIRFTVKYGWTLPLFMIKALKKNASTLQNISKERIREELDKILISPKPATGIRLLQLTGLMKFVIPELEELVGLSQNKYHKDDAFKHTLEVLKNVPPDIKKRLGALFHDIGKGRTKEIIDNEVHFYRHEEVGAEMAKEIMKALKYPNDVIDAVSTIVANHMRLKFAGDEAKVTDKSLRKLSLDLKDHLENVLDVMHSDNQAHQEGHQMPNQIPKIKELYKTLSFEPKAQHIKLPVTGNDIIEIYKVKGKAIGDALKFLEDKYLDNPNITREECLEFLDQYFNKQ